MTWKPEIEIKRGMLLRCESKESCPFGLAKTDEYTDDKQWALQVEYWGKNGHQLEERQTLVDVAHVRLKDGMMLPKGVKVYIYPRERLNPIPAPKVEKLLAPVPS